MTSSVSSETTDDTSSSDSDSSSSSLGFESSSRKATADEKMGSDSIGANSPLGSDSGSEDSTNDHGDAISENGDRSSLNAESRGSSGEAVSSTENGQLRRKLTPEELFLQGNLDISIFYVDATDFRILSVKGSGGAGTVSKAECLSTHKIVAMKELRVNQADEKAKLQYQREVGVLGTAHHPALLGLYGCTEFETEGEPPCIIMPFMEKGSVQDMIDKKPPPKEWDATRKHIVLYGTACGMMYMHSHRLIHRDMKPANILLDENYEPKIADFGLAKYVEHDKTFIQSIYDTGTCQFMAPEMFIPSRHYGFEVDVYAFGMVMYAVLTGEMPFGSMRILHVKAALLRKARPKFPKDFDEKYREIIEECWNDDPAKRPNFGKVVEDLGERFENVDHVVFEKYKEALSKADVAPGIRMEVFLSSGKWRDISAFYVNIDDYEKGDVIGYGGYGSVFHAKHKQTNESFALKELHLFGDEEYVRYTREVGIMGNVRHPTLLELCGCTPFENPPQYIVTRYMRNGSVSTMIRDNGKQKRAEWDATRKHIVLYGTAYGMMYLHKHRVIHRDLKPDNVFLDDDLEPKIADFGLSKFVDAGQSFQQQTMCGTPIFCAPELLSGSSYGFSVDVYAFGLFMFCVLSGDFPVEMKEWKSPQDWYKRIRGGWRPNIPDGIPESYHSLIEMCWDQDPNTRPTFHQVVDALSEVSMPSEIDVKSFKEYQERITQYVTNIPKSSVNVQPSVHEPTPIIPKADVQKHDSVLAVEPQPIEIKSVIMAEIEARQRRDVDFREFAEQECRTIKKQQPKVASKPLLQSFSNSGRQEKKQFKELSKRLNRTYCGSAKRQPKLNLDELPELYAFLKDNNAMIDECYAELLRMIYFTRRGNNDDHHLKDLLRILRFIATAFPPKSDLLVSTIYTQISRIARECSGDIQELAQHCFLRFDAITRTKQCKMLFCRAHTSKTNIASDVAARMVCFGVSLEEIFLFQTKRFPNLVVPKFLIDMVTKMLDLGATKRDDLFQANDHNFLECDQMISRLECGHENFMEGASLQDVMCLFRRWFRDLPVPILWKQEIESLKARSTDSEMLEFADKLPILSRYSLLYLVGFLQLLWKNESQTHVGISDLSRRFMHDITGRSEKEPAVSDPSFLECLIRNCDVSNIFPDGKS